MKKPFPDLDFPQKIEFCNVSGFSVTAQRKLRSAPELYVDGFLEIFLMLLIGP